MIWRLFLNEKVIPIPAYKDEKKGTWFVRFRYKDYNGKVHATTKRGFRTKKEALAYERESISSISGSPEMTVKSLAELFIKDKEARARKSSMRIIRWAIDGYVVPELGDIPISNIKPATVRNWQKQCAQKKNERTGKPLSTGSLHILGATLSSMLRFAVKYHGLPSNPCDVAGVMGRVNKKKDFWEQETFERFICTVSDKLCHAAYMTLYWTGLRAGELVALAPDDIDYEAGTISVNKTVSTSEKDMESHEPKTPESIRTISASKAVLTEIKALVDSYPYKAERVFDISSYFALQARFNLSVKKAGVPRITLHGFRHSHASWLISHGVPITAVSHRLGHASPQMTLAVYSHFINDDDRKIASLINKCSQNVVSEDDTDGQPIETKGI